MKNPICFTFLLGCVLLVATAYGNGGDISFQDLAARANQDGIYVYSLDGTPFTGTTYDEYDQGGLCIEYEIRNGLIQQNTGYYADGTMEREYHFTDGIPNGAFMRYHRNGKVFLEEHYVDGRMEGLQRRYNCNGSLRSEWFCFSGFILMKLDYETKPCEKGCKIEAGC